MSHYKSLFVYILLHVLVKKGHFLTCCLKNENVDNLKISTCLKNENVDNLKIKTGRNAGAGVTCCPPGEQEQHCQQAGHLHHLHHLTALPSLASSLGSCRCCRPGCRAPTGLLRCWGTGPAAPRPPPAGQPAPCGRFGRNSAQQSFRSFFI